MATESAPPQLPCPTADRPAPCNPGGRCVGQTQNDPAEKRFRDLDRVGLPTCEGLSLRQVADQREHNIADGVAFGGDSAILMCS